MYDLITLKDHTTCRQLCELSLIARSGCCVPSSVNTAPGKLFKDRFKWTFLGPQGYRKMSCQNARSRFTGLRCLLECWPSAYFVSTSCYHVHVSVVVYYIVEGSTVLGCSMLPPQKTFTFTDWVRCRHTTCRSESLLSSLT